jgi:hypothetical protein
VLQRGASQGNPHHHRAKQVTEYSLTWKSLAPRRLWREWQRSRKSKVKFWRKLHNFKPCLPFLPTFRFSSPLSLFLSMILLLFFYHSPLTGEILWHDIPCLMSYLGVEIGSFKGIHGFFFLENQSLVVDLLTGKRKSLCDYTRQKSLKC